MSKPLRGKGLLTLRKQRCQVTTSHTTEPTRVLLRCHLPVVRDGYSDAAADGWRDGDRHGCTAPLSPHPSRRAASSGTHPIPNSHFTTTSRTGASALMTAIKSSFCQSFMSASYADEAIVPCPGAGRTAQGMTALAPSLAPVGGC